MHPSCIRITPCHNAIYYRLISFTPLKTLKCTGRGQKHDCVVFYVLWSYYHFVAELRDPVTRIRHGCFIIKHLGQIHRYSKVD